MSLISCCFTYADVTSSWPYCTINQNYISKQVFLPYQCYAALATNFFAFLCFSPLLFSHLTLSLFLCCLLVQVLSEESEQ